MWWPFLQALHDHLAAWPALAAVPLRYGTGDAVPQSQGIDIDRGPERGDDLVHPRQGTITLWIDCWANHSDDAQAFAALAELEEEVGSALDDWQRNGARVAGADFNLDISERLPDGGIFRPTRGSRTSLNISWRMVE